MLYFDLSNAQEQLNWKAASAAHIAANLPLRGVEKRMYLDLRLVGDAGGILASDEGGARAATTHYLKVSMSGCCPWASSKPDC